MNDIIRSDEYDLCVLCIRPFDVSVIGTDPWLDVHENLVKLSQQAILEASTHREELAKELLIAEDKLVVFVHEIYCILVWRTKVLPQLIDVDVTQSNVNFILYTILYHEAVVVSLLEICLYHEDGCAALAECTIDLIDYCAHAITQLIGLVHIGHCQEDAVAGVETTVAELERHTKDLQYQIGLRCLTILSFLADKDKSLSINVIRRMVQTHDIPCLLSEIVHCQPWIRNVNGIEKYIDDKWTPVDGIDVIKVTKIEAHTWFCLYHLLYNRDAMAIYEINEFRQRELSKCQMLLGANVLDQLPPLVDLKRRLCTLELTNANQSSSQIIIEELPKIRDAIVNKIMENGGYDEVIRVQKQRFIDLTQNDVMKWARRLNSVYNFELMEILAETTSNSTERNGVNVCGQCGIEAAQKCSKCMQVFYCTRECQVKHWPQHKVICRNKVN